MANFALGLIAGAIIFGIATFVGFIQMPRLSARLFPSRVSRTVGAVSLLNSGSPLNSIEVLVLGPAHPPEWIGLAIQNVGFSELQAIAPVTLSVAEAKRLSELLAEAIAPEHRNG